MKRAPREERPSYGVGRTAQRWLATTRLSSPRLTMRRLACLVSPRQTALRRAVPRPAMPRLPCFGPFQAARA